MTSTIKFWSFHDARYVEDLCTEEELTIGRKTGTVKFDFIPIIFITALR